MFKQLLTALNTLSSPAGKKQASYKEQAKAKNLLSISELSNQLEKGEVNITELQSDKDFKVFSDSIKLDSSFLSQADDKGIVKLENVVIFSEKNFHNLHILETGYQFLAENQAQQVDENPEFACLNSNHTGDYPEQCFGEFTITEMSFDKGEIKANIEMDINHPAFSAQKYAMEQDPELQLGFSIEVGAVNGGFAYDKKDKAFLYSKPVIVGLATTLIPSAPGTLMNLEKPETLAIAEPAESVEDEMVEAGDYVLNAKKEMNYIASIIRDTSFVYQDITCSEADPVALLYNPAYWDWDEQDGNYSFANVSTLTKVHYNCEPNQLSVLKEKINISTIKLKKELKIESLEVKPETKPEEKPVVTQIETPTTNIALDSLKVEYEAKLQAQVNELTTKFMTKVDEINNKFKTELAQVRTDQETSFEMVIKTLTSQNETQSALNTSIRNLEKFNQPKPITTF